MSADSNLAVCFAISSFESDYQHKVDISRIATQLHIVAGPTSDYYDCIVAPLRYDLIVGVPWMIRNNANIDWDERLLWTHFGAIPEFVPASQGEGREPEEPKITCINVSPRDKLWEHAEALYDLQVAIVVNSVEVQDSPVPSMPVHPLASKFAELYKDRLRNELPDELPPNASRIHVWSCVRKLSSPIVLSTVCQLRSKWAYEKS
ncbi:hypothetical protein GGI09_002244 [Coemansia sp. S100]|nr:hypothetical protein GGI09_002244 [Coemansia sp. S100]